MKKAVVIGLVVAFLCASCGDKDEVIVTEGTGQGLPTVRLVTDAQGIGDKSYNAAAWRGILHFYGDTWQNQRKRTRYYDVHVCASSSDYVPVLKAVSEKKYGLICITGFTFADAVAEMAQQFPDQKYVIIDVNWLSAPNLMQITFSSEEGSYLVGVAAGLKAIEDGIKNPTFGFIGGIASPVITPFELGFVQGVLSVLPQAKFVDYYANDWGSPSLARTQAKKWYDAGVYAIFSAAGATGMGTILEAKERRLRGENVWAIGVDSDQYSDGLYQEDASAVLTSMLKKVETATEYALTAVKNDTFEGTVVKLDLAQDGVDLSVRNRAVTASMKKRIGEAKQSIIDKKVKVYTNYAEALVAKAVPKGLSAKD